MTMPDRRLLLHVNWGLVVSFILLFAVGSVNLYSASSIRMEDGIFLSSFYQKQLIWGIMGLGFMLLLMCLDYRHIERLAVPFYLIVILLLCLVPVAGKTVYGAKRWLDFGVFSLQPGELAKFAVLILGAKCLRRAARL